MSGQIEYWDRFIPAMLQTYLGNCKDDDPLLAAAWLGWQEATKSAPDLAEMRRQRDELASVLRDITQIGPLGIDTYPEVYRRIQNLARAAITSKEPRDG